MLYGSNVVELSIPGDSLIAVASPKGVSTEIDMVTQVQKAFKFPISAIPFADMLRKGDHLLLLVDDITRPTPPDQILPILLEELEVEKNNIETTILIALGTHRKLTQEEIDQKISHEIVAKYPVLNHEWDNRNALVDLGLTLNGTQIKINRLIEEVDKCLGIGNIAPHNLVGWSGGGKILKPGICGKETTYHIHLIAARCHTTNLGKMTNPVRAEIEQVANRSKMKWVFNTLLDRHGSGAGAHARCCTVSPSRGTA